MRKPLIAVGTGAVSFTQPAQNIEDDRGNLDCEQR